MEHQQVSLNRLPKVIDRVGLQKSAIYAKIAKGEFPAPIRISAGAVAWPSSAIDQWISDRMAEARK